MTGFPRRRFDDVLGELSFSRRSARSYGMATRVQDIFSTFKEFEAYVQRYPNLLPKLGLAGASASAAWKKNIPLNLDRPEESARAVWDANPPVMESSWLAVRARIDQLIG